MRRSLLRALARPLLPRFPTLAPEEQSRVEEDLEQFLAAQLGAMPGHLRLGVRAALVAFAWLPLLRWGRPYAALPAPTQARVVERWSASRIGPRRDLIRLLRSLTVFFYLDHPAVVARLEAESADALPRSRGS